MELSQIDRRATSICVRMWLATTTLIIFMVCVCFVMVKAPEKKVHVTSTDMVLIDEVSSLWCQGQEFVSSHRFNVYKLNEFNNSQPKSEKDTVFLKLHVAARKYQQIRYFLLKGSTVSLSALVEGSSNHSGTLNVVKGMDESERCNKDLTEFQSYNESTNSIEEDEFLTVSNQYKYLRWAMKTRKIPTKISSDSAVRIRAGSDDHYYFYVVNENPHHDIVVRLNISLNRIKFPVESNNIVCNKATHCLHHIGFAADVRLVLDIPREPDAGRSSFVVRTVCRPRIFFYALLFILVPVIILLIMGGVIKAYSSLLTLPYRENDNSLRYRIVRRLNSNDMTTVEVATPAEVTALTAVRTQSPQREYVQVLYHIPGELGLMDRQPTPGTPPPSYASLEKSRRLTPPINCATCSGKGESMLVIPPPKYNDAD